MRKDHFRNKGDSKINRLFKRNISTETYHVIRDHKFVRNFNSVEFLGKRKSIRNRIRVGKGG